jgi:hypothetical protein
MCSESPVAGENATHAECPMSRLFCETWENATHPIVQLSQAPLSHFSQKKREVGHPIFCY